MNTSIHDQHEDVPNNPARDAAYDSYRSTPAAMPAGPAGIQPPMRHISGVNVDVLRRAALANPPAAHPGSAAFIINRLAQRLDESEAPAQTEAMSNHDAASLAAAFSGVELVRAVERQVAATPPTPEPAQTEPWPEYVANIIETYLGFGKPAGDTRVKAIAGIIRRRMSFLPAVLKSENPSHSPEAEPAQQDTREAFEAWAQSKGVSRLDFFENNTYFSNLSAQHMWEAWQAAISAQKQAAPSGEASHSDTNQPSDAPLSVYEQRAVLADLQGLECLINYHDAQEAGADAMEPGWGKANAKRALELLALGRAIIAADPDLWHDAQKAPFKLRYSERATDTKGAD